MIPPNQQTFTDVSPDSTFWVYIERVALHGVVSGYSDTQIAAQPGNQGLACENRDHSIPARVWAVVAT